MRGNPARYVYIRNAGITTVVLQKRRVGRFLSFLLLGLGALLIFYVVFPIASWQILYASDLSSGNVLSPIPKAVIVNQSGVTAVPVDAAGTIPTGFDSSKASNWFPTDNPRATQGIKEYSLSIPRLGIQDANVIVGSDDLFKSLIHYGGSSLPGEYGNAVVFGHSTLPQFFNPKNYKSIFATLHTLKVGDTINISADGVSYKYTIFNFKVVDPSEISVLEQTYDDAYLTLITCTPPGTYWKRLVVKARLDKI